MSIEDQYKTMFIEVRNYPSGSRIQPKHIESEIQKQKNDGYQFICMNELVIDIGGCNGVICTFEKIK